MNISKLWERVADRRAWGDVVFGAPKSVRLNNNNNETSLAIYWVLIALISNVQQSKNQFLNKTILKV